MINNFWEKIKVLAGRLKTYFKRQSTIRKVFIVGGMVIGFACLSVFAFVILVWAGAFGYMPDKKELSEIENPAASEVYTADSVLLGRYFIQERSTIHYEDIPDVVENALLATEDIRFYKHHGIDIQSLFRVLFKSILLQDESSGGGSTITQQLVKNLYPRKSYRFGSLVVNKVREMIIAWRIENIYDKKEILTLYLNTIPFADNTFGIEAASQRFFSVPVASLTLDQAAVLVGMLKATHLYNPRIFPERATQRRNVVFSQMVKYGLLSEEKSTASQKIPLELKYHRITHHSGLAPYFRAYIRKELLEWCKTNKKTNGEPYNLYTDGLKIYTTIDSRLQQYAEEAVESQMAITQKKFETHWNKHDPWYKKPEVLTDAIRRSDRYKSLAAQGLNEADIKKEMDKEIAMNIFTWQGSQEVKMSPLDSIKHYLRFLNAGFLAMEPGQGAIRAWVGGIDHHFFQYDHVKPTTRRQVGSTFKPIVYAAALEQGANPCDFISAEKTMYTNIKDMDSWTPENNDQNYSYKYSMEGALAYSVNTVSVKVLEKAGIQHTVRVANKMGIESTIPAVPSLALGVADLSMFEMVKAYACFANKGKPVKPFYITSITTSRGEILQAYKALKPTYQAISPRTAEMIVHMLKRTVNEGTGGKLRWEYGIKNDMGGKTGTTQSNADGWFMAITPKLIIGSWVGADDPRIRFRSTSLGQGSSTALPVVAKFLQKVNNDPELKTLSEARFPKISNASRRALSCDLYKTDLTFWESLFGPSEPKDVQRDFGKEVKRDGLFKKLFKKKS
ncbi:MAG TPA: transglycosylase domain-containing protein [Ohtaekwangia sp.]|nr:transglycosylase domain-containing protein [Ohtaekwangia sp.]